MKKKYILPFIAVILLLTGCAASSPNARKLARKTAANTSFLSSQIVEAAASNRRTTELRRQQLAEFRRELHEQKTRQAIDRALVEKIGGDNWRLFQQLDEWADKVEKLHAADEVDDIALASYEHGRELGEVAKILGELGDDEDTKGQIKFIAKFVGQVIGDTQLMLEEEKQASQEAQAALEAAGDEGSAATGEEANDGGTQPGVGESGGPEDDHGSGNDE